MRYFLRSSAAPEPLRAGARTARPPRSPAPIISHRATEPQRHRTLNSASLRLRGGHGGAQEDSPRRGSVAASFASQLAGYGALGNFGGAGNATDGNWGYYSASGGGGGAMTAGGTPTDYTTGGNGGEGLASDITGTLRVPHLPN